MRYLDILLERKKRRDYYLSNLSQFFKKISLFFKKKLGKKTKILVFGSFIKKKFGPNSDIDILVISQKEISDREKRKLIFQIRKKIGFLSPFEFHLTDKKEFQNWWQRFIKKDFVEIK